MTPLITNFNELGVGSLTNASPDLSFSQDLVAAEGGDDFFSLINGYALAVSLSPRKITVEKTEFSEPRNEQTLFTKSVLKSSKSSKWQYEYPDGVKYEGSEIHKNGMKNPHNMDKKDKEYMGVLIYPDGSTYEGLFKSGKRHGEGILRCHGFVYEGSFQKGKREGLGTMIFTDGGIYNGPIKNEPNNSEDFSKYLNGAKFKGCYTGSFINDKQDGHGIMTYPNGSKYEGLFENGRRKDCGKMTYIDGSSYFGASKDDRTLD